MFSIHIITIIINDDTPIYNSIFISAYLFKLVCTLSDGEHTVRSVVHGESLPKSDMT